MRVEGCKHDGELYDHVLAPELRVNRLPALVQRCLWGHCLAVMTGGPSMPNSMQRVHPRPNRLTSGRAWS